MYKQDVEPLTESGAFASDYTTTFLNDPNDPKDAQIRWDGSDFLSNATHLLVKDGKHDPGWYLFSLVGWDGKMGIDLLEFWPDQGAISHVAIYGGGGGTIPEPTAALVWSLLLGVGLVCRRGRK
ncbi:MAG: hypothetical protein ABGX16_18500 [Pirellulales bacterium]